MSASYMQKVSEYWANNNGEEKMMRSKALSIYAARQSTLYLQIMAYEMSVPLEQADEPEVEEVSQQEVVVDVERKPLVLVKPNKPEEGKVYSLHKLQSHNGKWSQAVVQDDPEDEPVPLLDLF